MIQSTHWVGCWRLHLECAVRRIEELLDVGREMASEIEATVRQNHGIPKEQPLADVPELRRNRLLRDMAVVDRFLAMDNTALPEREDG